MKKIVCFGEIMMRLAPAGYKRFMQAQQLDVFYGGGESNVAISLSHLGLPSSFVTRLPGNDLGDCALMELRKMGVETSNIIRGGERLGLYFLEKGAVNRASKVIYDRSHSSMATIRPGMVDWRSIMKNAIWFHWSGITPAISQGAADVCMEALEMAKKLGVMVSVDLNYRKKLWKYGKRPDEVMPDLVNLCDVILGNEEDTEKHFGIAPHAIDVKKGESVYAEAYRSVLEEMKNRFPRAKKIITTLRGSISASHNTWSGVLYDGSMLYTAPQYQITHIVDRVGGGDSFMAGLIYGLLKFDGDNQRALNFAVAASCLKHTIPGDANLVSADEVLKLVDGDGSGRVSR